jgi:hypothetical protein
MISSSRYDHPAGPSNMIVPYYVSAKQLQITRCINYYGHSSPEGRGASINRKEHRAITNLKLLGLFELEGCIGWIFIYFIPLGHCVSCKSKLPNGETYNDYK